MIAVFIIVTLFISILHFIYDGIILPSIRQNYRNELFALRDELRWIMIEGIDNTDIAAFNLVHDAINSFANRLPLLTMSVQKSFQIDMQNNVRLREIIKKRREIIHNCNNDDIKRIVNDVNLILEKTYISNAGGWFIYIIPIAITAVVFKKIAVISAQLTIAPPQEVHRILPHQDNSACC